MSKHKQISITLSEEALEYLEFICRKNSRSRSSMLGWMLLRDKALGESLDVLQEEDKIYGKNCRT